MEEVTILFPYFLSKFKFVFLEYNLCYKHYLVDKLLLRRSKTLRCCGKFDLVAYSRQTSTEKLTGVIAPPFTF